MILNDHLHGNTQQFLFGANATTRADHAYVRALDNLIKRLVSVGWWDALDVMCLTAPVQADALRNIRNPGTYDATAVNTPTYSYNSAGNWGFDIATTGDKYVNSNCPQGSRNWFGWVYNRVKITAYATSAQWGAEYTKYPGGGNYTRTYCNTEGTSGIDYRYSISALGPRFSNIGGHDPGFFGASRYDTSTVFFRSPNGYGSGTSYDFTYDVDYPGDGNIFIGRVNDHKSGAGGFHADGAQIAGWGFGPNIFSSASELNTFGSYIQQFMTDIGANV